MSGLRCEIDVPQALWESLAMAATRSQIQSLPADDQQKLQSWLDALQTSWSQERLSAIVALLPESGDSLRPVALSEIVKADINRQWQSGQEVRLEDYLDTYPELGTTDTVPAELVYAEFEARRQAGHAPDINELAGRFPAQAEILKALVETEAEAPTPLDEKQPRASVETESSRVSTHSELKTPTAVQDLPTEFGRYRVEQKLGQGAMGAVYLARDTELGRKVALKIPMFSQTERPKLVERFYREARAAATLDHQHICTVYDVGEIDGIRFISMAYIEGKPMSAYIHPDKLQSPRQVAQVMRKLASALEEAHTAGIIHRDLKPTNIMFDKKREPIIMDFGLARQVDQDADQSRLTQEGTVIGTPAYMAPEQVKADLEQMGPVTDVYSLGIILYELLTGRLPFEGPIAAVLGQVLTIDAEPPSTINPEVDPGLEVICLRAIAKEISDRYQTMREFAEAFTEWLRSPAAAVGTRRGLRAAVSDTGPGDEAEIFQTAVGETTSPRTLSLPSRPRGTRRKPAAKGWAAIPPAKRWLIGGGAAAFLLLGVIIVIKTQEGTVEIDTQGKPTKVTIAGDNVTVDTAQDEQQENSGVSGASTQQEEEFYASFPVDRIKKLDFCRANRFEGSPSLAPGMLEMFVMGIDPSGPGREDLFVARRNALSEPFRDIVALRFAGSREHEYNPFVSADGLSLFFTSARSGKRDIYVSARSHVRAEFGVAQPLTGANTDQIESRPVVSADGKTLLFLRFTQRGARDAEIFRASLKHDGDRVIASNVTKTNLPTYAHPVVIGNRGSVLFAQTDQQSLRYGMAKLYATWSNAGPANFVNPVEIMSIGNGEWNTLTSFTADARVMFFRSGLDVYSMRLADETAATIRRVLAWKPGDPPPVRESAPKAPTEKPAEAPAKQLAPTVGRTPEEIARRRQEYLEQHLTPLLEGKQEDVSASKYASQFPPKQKTSLARSTRGMEQRFFTKMDCQQAILEAKVKEGKVAHCIGTFDADDRLVRVEAVDQKGGLRIGSLGSAVADYWYDEDGNRIQEVYRDTNRTTPIENNQLVMIARHVYENGNRVETRFYDIKRKPAEDHLGVHRRLYKEGETWLEYRLDGSHRERWLEPLSIGKRINGRVAFHPAFALDGKELYFATETAGAAPPARYTIRRCTWLGDRWSDPEDVMAGGRKLLGMRPALSGDGRLMAFVAWRTRSSGRTNAYPEVPDYIFTCERKDGIWQTPQDPGATINRFDPESGVAIEPVSNDLLLPKNRYEGLLRSKRSGNKWHEPQQLNFDRGSLKRALMSPCFSGRNTSRLYLTTSGKSCFGYADASMSEKNDGRWSRPINLGPPVNSSNPDGDSALSPDGRIMYMERGWRYSGRGWRWNILVTGRTDSEVAIRHMAEIYALGEWDVEGPPAAAPSLEEAKSISDLSVYQAVGNALRKAE
jgi:serine/threonine protein kinase